MKKTIFNTKDKLLSIISIILILMLLTGCNSSKAPEKSTESHENISEFYESDSKSPSEETQSEGESIEEESSADDSKPEESSEDDSESEESSKDDSKSEESSEDNSESEESSEDDSKSEESSEDSNNSTFAKSYEEAIDRSKKGILSGDTIVPDQAPSISEYRPMKDGKYILNSSFNFIDENTYAVVDAYGKEVFRVYRGGGYITLEEVAAYIYAFGDIPANYTANKNTKPYNSIWGEHLRVNHTKFSGNTYKYPYEPKLPNISGCGGDLQYYELDIGTTGTDCDPKYPAKLYNNGQKITRGAARIVYGKCDLDKDGVYEFGELHLFYTYNHYNDFQEYLNYFGGWGEAFGNITGGGTISSKTDYNPTPYVDVVREVIAERSSLTMVCCYIPKKYWIAA
ncbi:MAG: hypothetical protein E7614_05145 [Ruminococcaceae bacterium]|nr:hypothetical protein [Oscillospiraceae bacterium]